ncbi:hypothetical protein GCM10010177_00450 [Actinomadura citrea]|jgi:hypothetical protein|nr:hypothetical protein GCM10010177_00450 [Actinomadura citrea]
MSGVRLNGGEAEAPVGGGPEFLARRAMRRAGESPMMRAVDRGTGHGEEP